jgi:hypothetical protein
VEVVENVGCFGLDIARIDFFDMNNTKVHEFIDQKNLDMDCTDLHG